MQTPWCSGAERVKRMLGGFSCELSGIKCPLYVQENNRAKVHAVCSIGYKAPSENLHLQQGYSAQGSVHPDSTADPRI